MVASVESSRSDAGPGSPGPETPPTAAGGGAVSGVHAMADSVKRLMSSTTRLALLRAKLTARNLAMAAGLWLVAVALAVPSIIFLDLGLVHLLTDIAGLQPAWAYLILAGAHIVVALSLVLWAASIFRKPISDVADEKPAESAGDSGT